MSVIAIIPARGGSKRLPRKNLIPLAGQPLVAHSIRHAMAASAVDTVYVSTDDEEIAAVARSLGATPVPRPAELANDTATSESALLHVLDWRRAAGLADPELVVFLQPTSPIRRAGDIDNAVGKLRASKADSLFSACENSWLIWAEDAAGPRSLTYDFHRRQRDQDMAEQWRENGSIYVFDPALLRQTGNRLGGRIAVYEMDYWSSFQIDTPEHAQLCEWILRSLVKPEPAWPASIDLVVFDFDGVMTDNAVWLNEQGDELVRCDRGDGWGIGMLRRAGVQMRILTTEERPLALRRAEKLNLPCDYAVKDKAAFLRQHLAGAGIDPARVAYVGNDLNDLEAMRLVGLPVSPADGHPEVRQAARLVLESRGGFGAVREFCERLLAHRGGTATR